MLQYIVDFLESREGKYERKYEKGMQRRRKENKRFAFTDIFVERMMNNEKVTGKDLNTPKIFSSMSFNSHCEKGKYSTERERIEYRSLFSHG